MTPKRKQRMALVALMVLGVGTAIALALVAFNKNLMLFHSPSDIAAGGVEPDVEFRVGGMVVDGSVSRDDDLNVQFQVSDMAENVTIQYKGILPDLFSEGQGIVALGALNSEGVFVAKEVLAKHDENYMPPEVAEALKEAGKMPGTEATFGTKTVVSP